MDDFAEAFTVGDDATSGHEGFHGAAEGGLGGVGELVEFVNNDDFEAFLLLGVELLAAGDFFDEFLDDDAVVEFGFAGRDFDVVHGAEDDGGAGG